MYCKSKFSLSRDAMEDAIQGWIRFGETEVRDRSRDCTKNRLSEKVIASLYQIMMSLSQRNLKDDEERNLVT